MVGMFKFKTAQVGINKKDNDLILFSLSTVMNVFDLV